MTEQATIAELIDRAHNAQLLVSSWSQSRIDAMVAVVGWRSYEQSTAHEMAARSFQETGIGREGETCARHRRRVLGTLCDLQGVRTTGIVDADPARGVIRIAKPIGIVASITPVTAPTAAICQNALLALKTGNAIVFCPHPRAKMIARFVTQMLRAALSEAAAPADLIQCVAEPGRDTVEQLMAAADLILAAGGPGAVRRAYTSGTPAFGGGAGNAVVVVDETADLADAAAKIHAGKSFDNGTSCSAESSIVIAAEAWNALVEKLCGLGSYLCDRDEVDRLREVMWPAGGRLSNAVVGQDARTIARLACIDVPENTRVLMAAPEGVAGQDPFSREKLSPVLALWKFREFSEAIRLVQDMTASSGRGHSCGIHSLRAERIDDLSQQVDVSRVMVNQSTGLGNSGDFTNGMPFTATLCCGSWGGSITNDNITWKHLLNYTWVSRPLEERSADLERIFADCTPRVRPTGAG
jgi:sulfoacetaldehyde dehydrogenase